PATVAFSVPWSSEPLSVPLPVPVSGLLSDRKTTLSSKPVTSPKKSIVAVKAIRYWTGTPPRVPLRLACPTAVSPCWSLITNDPARLTEPVTSHGPAAGRDTGPVGGGEDCVNCALADLNFSPELTEIAVGNALRPLLVLSASGNRLSKLATADRKYCPGGKVSSSITCVGNVAVAPAASRPTSCVATSEPARGLAASKSALRTMYRPMLNGGESTTPILRTVLGVGTPLPVTPPVGEATDTMTRSGRKSRIVTEEAFTPATATFTGSLSMTVNTRLPFRRE